MVSPPRSTDLGYVTFVGVSWEAMVLRNTVLREVRFADAKGGTTERGKMASACGVRRRSGKRSATERAIEVTLNQTKKAR